MRKVTIFKTIAVAAAVALTLAACSSSSKSNSSGSSAESASSSGSSPSGSASGSPVSINAPLPAGGNGGSTDVGVTATQIKTVTITSASGDAPGQALGAYYGVKAYFDWVNSQGGIYGRKLVTDSKNDQFTPTVAKAICSATAPSTFAYVGAASVGESGCFDIVKSQVIPWTPGEQLDPQFNTLPNATNNPDVTKIANGYLVYLHNLYPKATKVAVLYVNVPGVQALANQAVAAAKSAGFTGGAVTLPIPLGAPDLTQYVLQMKQKGIQVVDAYALDQTSVGRLAAAMSQQGWTPQLKLGNNVYNSVFDQLAGPGAAGWYQALNYLPFLDAADTNSTPGGQLFLSAMHASFPKYAPDAYTILGWTAATLFVKGLIAAGPKLTRADYVTAANAITSFDADGFIGAYVPPSRIPTNCFVLVQSLSSGYKRIEPTGNGQFACNYGSVVTIPVS